jgi:hypothetical protein
MNKTRQSVTGKFGFVLCTGLLGALTGCTTYVDQPRSHGGLYHYQEPPRPREVYVPPPAVQVEASFGSVGVVIRTESDFYEPLASQGEWVVIGSYGRCWRPGRVEAGWRPYCNGNWQRTDAGWYWASDEPWAWATYHYGRWDFTEQYGWYWVPQTQWAPAWVSWHEGGGYVGWAPLHPSARIAVGGSVSLNVALIAPRAFVFVEPRRFLQPVRPTTVVINNTTIINKTVNITNIKVVNNTVINEGPRTQVIEQASKQKLQAVPVRELRRKQEAEVVARQRIATPAREKKEGNVQTPVRSEAEPRETKAPLDAQRRAKEPEATAEEQPQKNARELENKTQVEPQRRANEAAAKVQEEARSKAKESERTAQQRGKELEKKTQQQSQKNPRELENKTQVESQGPANAAAKVQEETRGKAKASERTAQREIQRRKELEKKAQAEAERKAQKNKGKGKPSPPEDPPVAPPASP